MNKKSDQDQPELGLSVDEVVVVCDSRVDAREVRWLRRLARERSGSSS